MDPGEFLLASFGPERIIFVSETLGRLIVRRKRTRLLHQLVSSLHLHLGKFVHVLATSMILLILGVLDGLSQTSGQSLSIGAVNADHFVVHLETFDSLDLFEGLLKIVFEVHGQAAIVVVN